MDYHHNLSANFVPGGIDDYMQPHGSPQLLSPNPQRIEPELAAQIQDGMRNMDLQSDMPNFSPFPKLQNPPPNVPQSDEQLETTLEDARKLVLNSNDPEMQLAWAQDALIHCGVCEDHEQRLIAARPQSARPVTPRVEHQIKTDAMGIVGFLADQHHPKAEFLKGMWYEFGRFGIREDKKEAFRCYSRAADRGYVRAEYRIGMMYESNNDPIKGLRHYTKGVEAGDAASCYRMGMMTLRGQNGQQQDFARGVQLIRQSAESADENAAQGAYVYGMLLARELPQVEVPEHYLQYDERLARQMIEKAAYLKFAKAQLKMGLAYELGSLGCEFNPTLSMHYMALAAQQGEPDAEMALSKWFLVGSEGLFQKNEDLAYTYAERAAASGLPTAEFAMGYFNEIGMKVPTDLDKAMQWYQKAAAHGNTDAKARIEGLQNKQVLSRSDHEQVALNRIRSTHGSMRGQRPARLQQKALPMAPIEETSSRHSSYSQASHLPPRGSSMTPYPEDDGPPQVAMAAQDLRQKTTTPYPLEGGPLMPHSGQRPPPTGGFFAPQQNFRPASAADPYMRPSSAFHLTPDDRPYSTASLPAFTPHSQQYPGQPYPAGQQQAYPPARPATAVSAIDPRPRPNGARVSSSSAVMQAVPSPRPQQQRASNFDVGFTAAPEDRTSKKYYQAIQHPQPVPQPPEHVRARLPQSNSAPAFDGRASTPGARTSSRPDHARPLDPRTPRPSQGAPSAAGPPSVPSKTAAPTATAVAATSKPSSQAAGKPVKGPKTFEEMGVPKTKDHQDCIVM